MKKLIGGEKGQGMVEYGLIIGMIALAAFALAGSMGVRLQSLFQSLSTFFTGVAG